MCPICLWAIFLKLGICGINFFVGVGQSTQEALQISVEYHSCLQGPFRSHGSTIAISESPLWSLSRKFTRNFVHLIFNKLRPDPRCQLCDDDRCEMSWISWIISGITEHSIRSKDWKFLTVFSPNLGNPTWFPAPCLFGPWTYSPNWSLFGTTLIMEAWIQPSLRWPMLAFRVHFIEALLNVFNFCLIWDAWL